jgi:geranylgeranyl diphosphate synthase type I
VDLPEQHAQLRSDITEALRDFLTQRRFELKQIGDELAPVMDELERFVLDGGKRLRPIFAYWGWRGAGGSDSPTNDSEHRAAITAAASLEFIQACGLIHDDVMDGSLTRRGRPAVHRHFAALHHTQVGHGDGDAHGVALAILLGDFALAWADDLLRGSGFPPERLQHAWPVFERMRTELFAGQYLDLASQAYGEPNVARARRVAVFKSAKYTVERPLQLGAALGDGSPALMHAYSDYGLPLGEAFQLRDDVLSVFGNPDLTGKPAGDDLREGKRTVLVAMTLERANPAQSALLQQGLGSAELSEEDLDRLRNIIVETGALAELETMISHLTERSLAALTKAADTGTVTADAAEALVQLANAATSRVR